ncbi:MAG: hypothetical protein GYA87_07320 [Christensenellaceae bacterium]|nr:hypothetical protein [Christensenellaceae bacterium]
MKKFLAIILSLAMMLSLVSFTAFAEDIESIIQQAEQMTNEELYKKAIEESNGQILYGIGNSSRGKTAGASFVEKLKSIDPNYTGTIEWSQPKNNSIFTTLNADIKSAQHIYSMTLIQDGNQIQSKMVNTGNLLNFIPLDWKNAEGVDVEGAGNPLTLQTLNKVFMVNNTDGTAINNAWEFVAEGSAPLFMGVNSELVGKNFLYMLTHEKYANYMKAAFDALSDDQKAYFQPIVDEVSADADALGLTAENAAYSLAWIKLWCEQYTEDTDDGPICATLVSKSAAGQSGLLVYSKLRSIEESAESSVNNVVISAYQDDYVGIGGYGYRHYLQVVKTAPLPWTACAFISYMVTEKEGFAAWGKDMGGYSPNPAVMQDHSQDGFVDGVDTFPAKNDRGYEWWVAEDGGQLVIEDPEYCSMVSFDLGDWIDMIVGNK